MHGRRIEIPIRAGRPRQFQTCRELIAAIGIAATGKSVVAETVTLKTLNGNAIGRIAAAERTTEGEAAANEAVRSDFDL